MGQKDITEKMLVDYNDVFADIVNVLLFNGKMVVDENELKNVKDKSQYKIDGKIHEEERDAAKILNDKKIQIAFIGFEHQTDGDKDEPFRVISYDGDAYKRQLLSESKDRYPVITLVLYFGSDRWKQPKSLYQALDIREEWKPFVNDYKINLFEISYLESEQVEMFTSDFKIVADYFVQMRKNKDYIPSRETIRHVDEVLKLMSVLTKDDRFKQAQDESEGAGGVKNMCEAMDKAEKRGKEIGQKIGELRGAVRAYYDMKLSEEAIAEKMSISVSEVEEIISSMGLAKQ